MSEDEHVSRWQRFLESYEAIERSLAVYELYDNTTKIVKSILHVVAHASEIAKEKLPLAGNIIEGLGFISKGFKRKHKKDYWVTGVKVLSGVSLLAIGVVGLAFPPAGLAMLFSGLAVSAGMSVFRGVRAWSKMNSAIVVRQQLPVNAAAEEVYYHKNRYHYKRSRRRTHFFNAVVGVFSAILFAVAIAVPPVAAVAIVSAAAVSLGSFFHNRHNARRQSKFKQVLSNVRTMRNKQRATQKQEEKSDKAPHQQESLSSVDDRNHIDLTASPRPVNVESKTKAAHHHAESTAARVHGAEDIADQKAESHQPSLSEAKIDNANMKITPEAEEQPAAEHHAAASMHHADTLERMAHQHVTRSFADAHPDVKASARSQPKTATEAKRDALSAKPTAKSFHPTLDVIKEVDGEDDEGGGAVTKIPSSQHQQQAASHHAYNSFLDHDEVAVLTGHPLKLKQEPEAAIKVDNSASLQSTHPVLAESVSLSDISKVLDEDEDEGGEGESDSKPVPELSSI